MAECVFCGEKTILHQSGQPICVRCSELIDAGKPPKKPVAKEESSAKEDKASSAGPE